MCKNMSNSFRERDRVDREREKVTSCIPGKCYKGHESYENSNKPASLAAKKTYASKITEISGYLAWVLVKLAFVSKKKRKIHFCDFFLRHTRMLQIAGLF